MLVSGLCPEPLEWLASQNDRAAGQGVDACRRCGRIWRPAPRFRAPRPTGAADSHGEDTRKPAQAGNPPGHRRPRHQRPARLRQSGGLSRLDRALSDRRGSGRPPLALSIWPPRHADLGSAGKGARGDRRRRPAPASPCCPRAWRRFRPRCCRSPAPAITSWSPTASTGRPAISANGVFKRMGVETTYYDPLIGAGIAKLFKPNTRAVFVEAPGSQSFEMQDIPAIAKVAHDKGARGADGQYLGDAALFPRLRERRRSVDPGRHQIYRRPFRHHVRLRVGQRQDAAGAQGPS